MGVCVLTQAYIVTSHYKAYCLLSGDMHGSLIVHMLVTPVQLMMYWPKRVRHSRWLYITSRPFFREMWLVDCSYIVCIHVQNKCISGRLLIAHYTCKILAPELLSLLLRESLAVFPLAGKGNDYWTMINLRGCPLFPQQERVTLLMRIVKRVRPNYFDL